MQKARVGTCAWCAEGLVPADKLDGIAQPTWASSSRLNLLCRQLWRRRRCRRRCSNRVHSWACRPGPLAAHCSVAPDEVLLIATLHCLWAPPSPHLQGVVAQVVFPFMQILS